MLRHNNYFAIIRLKALREPVYTHKEAEMAAGVGKYQLPPPPLKPKARSALRKRRSRRTVMDMEPDELGMRMSSMGIRTEPSEQRQTAGLAGSGNPLAGIDVGFENLRVT